MKYFKSVSAWFYAALLVAMLCACSGAMKYVPDESRFSHTERGDTVYVAALRVDSVISRDTVNTFISGDTVRLEITRWRIRDRLRVDTVFQAKSVAVRDTVIKPVPFPVEKQVTVEKPLSDWQRFKIGSFWILMIYVFLSLCYCFRRPLLKALCRLKL